jgi:hypothetical protein
VPPRLHLLRRRYLFKVHGRLITSEEVDFETTGFTIRVTRQV